MVRFLIVILVVGTFYNIGKTKSKLNAIIWAFLSFFVWILTMKVLRSFFDIRGILAVIAAVIVQFPLGLLEMAISKRQENKRVFMSATSLFYNSLSSIFTLTLDFDFVGVKELKIFVFNENEELLAEVYNDPIRSGLRRFDFKLNNLDSGTYTLKIKLEKKEFINKFVYFKGSRAALLKG